MPGDRHVLVEVTGGRVPELGRALGVLDCFEEKFFSPLRSPEFGRKLTTARASFLGRSRCQHSTLAGCFFFFFFPFGALGVPDPVLREEGIFGHRHRVRRVSRLQALLGAATRGKFEVLNK
jgi:hypothetical protein